MDNEDGKPNQSDDQPPPCPSYLRENRKCARCGRWESQHSVPFEYATLADECSGGFLPVGGWPW